MKTIHSILAALALALPAGAASAHAFPDHADPKVGSKIATAPAAVKIWFTEKLDPASSRIRVFAAAGQAVDKGGTHLAPTDASLLVVDLPPLKPGIYKVAWKATSADGHRTEGDFKFQIAP